MDRRSKLDSKKRRTKYETIIIINKNPNILFLIELVEAESSENFCGRRCSTLGTITPDPLFFELASKVVNIDQIYGCSRTFFSWNFFFFFDMLFYFLAEMDFRVTYLFELCCAENRIVTIYPSNRSN